MAAARLLGQGVAVIISVIVIRLLEPSDYGLMAIALVFLGLILLLNEMGLGAALVQQREVEQSEIEQVFGLLLMVNLVLYAAVYLAAPLVATYFREPQVTAIIQVISLRLPLMSLLVIPRAMLQREMRFRAKSLVDLAGGLTASFATLTLALLGFGLNATDSVGETVTEGVTGKFTDKTNLYLVGGGALAVAGVAMLFTGSRRTN